MTHPHAEPRQVLSLWHGTINAPPLPRTANEIIEDICLEHACTVDEIRGKSRVRRIAHARQHAAWELHLQMHPRRLDESRWSYPKIAELLGYGDHTSAYCAVRDHKRRAHSKTPQA